MCSRARRWHSAWHGSVRQSAALILAALALPALAQSQNVLSESECAACRAQLPPTPFDGIWSSALTAAVEPGWALEDYFCFTACTSDGRAAARRLLAGGETAHRSTLDLYPKAVAANVQSVERLLAAPAEPSRPSYGLPGLSCDRPGFAAQVVSALPLEIETRADRVTMSYEEFGIERTIAFDGHGPQPQGERGSLGTSKARLERGVLVVETSGIAAGRLSEWLGGFEHTDALRAVERYSISEDDRWLELTLTFDDPAMLAQPLVVMKRWLRTPRARILQYRCDVMSAGLRGVFAEYVDPRIVDARRPVLQR